MRAKGYKCNNVKCDRCVAHSMCGELGDIALNCIDRIITRQTNAQKIRSMTDDELNDLFHEIYNAGVDDAVAYEWGQRTNSFEWTMEWLQKPAEGE